MIERESRVVVETTKGAIEGDVRHDHFARGFKPAKDGIYVVNPNGAEGVTIWIHPDRIETISWIN